MSSILLPSLHILRQSRPYLCAHGIPVASLFHTTSTLQGGGKRSHKKTKKASSRTRLVKDLTPGPSFSENTSTTSTHRGPLKIPIPKQPKPAFERDTVPHTDGSIVKPQTDRSYPSSSPLQRRKAPEREREGRWRKEGAYNDTRSGRGGDNGARNEGKMGDKDRRNARDHHPRDRQKSAERTPERTRGREQPYGALNYGRRERPSERDRDTRKMDDRKSGWERTAPRDRDSERSAPALGSNRDERPSASTREEQPQPERHQAMSKYGTGTIAAEAYKERRRPMASLGSRISGRSRTQAQDDKRPSTPREEQPQPERHQTMSKYGTGTIAAEAYKERRRPTASLGSRISGRGRTQAQDDKRPNSYSNRFEERTDPRTDVTDSTQLDASTPTPLDTAPSSSSPTPPADVDADVQTPRKRSRHLPIITEFYPSPPSLHRPPTPSAYSSHEIEETSPTQGYDLSTSQLPLHFTSPPLMPGLLSCLTDVLGPVATPTPIQGLALKWIMGASGEMRDASRGAEVGKWKEFLLASETGSGKSIAYLLPVLQALKQSELHPSPPPISTPTQRPRAQNPRALILAPTHELARQLSGFAKALLHEIKLRVVCASQANVASTSSSGRGGGTAGKMAGRYGGGGEDGMGGLGEFEIRPPGKSRPVDLIVGTPMKLLDMVRGRGWDRKEAGFVEPVEAEEVVEDEDGLKKRKPRRGSDLPTDSSARSRRGEPEMGLANVEWVVVDEADVLFDPDFQETTRMLLSDISAARGAHVPVITKSPLSYPSHSYPSSSPTDAIPRAISQTDTSPEPIIYPFNLLLTTATIPSSLGTYLSTYHPSITRLASPNLHHLPTTLQMEYVNWSGGNKDADVERRIRRVWAEDAAHGGLSFDRDGDETVLSKVLIFCNKSSRVDELGAYLTERGIKNVALTSTSEMRKRGSNHHLDGFLRQKVSQDDKEKEKGAKLPTPTPAASTPKSKSLKAMVESQSKPLPTLPSSTTTSTTSANSVSETAHVMITTSLLSRGLDFSPSIRHVFIVDEPRNMIDFLHRAGRSGRAGEKGKVVVFGKMKGRGSASAKDVRRRVGALVA